MSHIKSQEYILWRPRIDTFICLVHKIYNVYVFFNINLLIKKGNGVSLAIPEDDVSFQRMEHV